MLNHMMYVMIKSVFFIEYLEAYVIIVRFSIYVFGELNSVICTGVQIIINSLEEEVVYYHYFDMLMFPKILKRCTNSEIRYKRM